jgi:hypothetical protein
MKFSFFLLSFSFLFSLALLAKIPLLKLTVPEGIDKFNQNGASAVTNSAQGC